MVGGITAVAGTTGTLWVSGGEVWRADRAGSRVEPLPADLEAALDVPGLDASGRSIEFLPFVRMARYLAQRIREPGTSPAPAGATFADGVAVMDVVDALKLSSQSGGDVRAVPAAADR